MMKDNVKQLVSIPAGKNPLIYDLYHMGTYVASNVLVMHYTHPTEKAKYVIVVNTETGQRLRINVE